MKLLEFWFQNPRIWFKATPNDDIYIYNLVIVFIKVSVTPVIFVSERRLLQEE